MRCDAVVTVLRLHRVKGCSECDERCQQMPLRWDGRGAAPAIAEGGGERGGKEPQSCSNMSWM